MNYHLAQINIAQALAPMTDPIMAGFVAQLDTINALADTAPGFVWRLQTESGNATTIRVFDDERLIVNLSVWESIEALSEFAYKTTHTQVMSHRKEWFERMSVPYLAMWWIPAGHIPTVLEAKARLEHLQLHGPTAYAFQFKTRFPTPHPEIEKLLND
ncbi:MAG: DUF3291 domain-containing protein [Aggregatilineales bacterium]